jgi:hypothetical protein
MLAVIVHVSSLVVSASGVGKSSVPEEFNPLFPDFYSLPDTHQSIELFRPADVTGVSHFLIPDQLNEFMSSTIDPTEVNTIEVWLSWEIYDHRIVLNVLNKLKSLKDTSPETKVILHAYHELLNRMRPFLANFLHDPANFAAIEIRLIKPITFDHLDNLNSSLSSAAAGNISSDLIIMLSPTNRTFAIQIKPIHDGTDDKIAIDYFFRNINSKSINDVVDYDFIIPSFNPNQHIEYHVHSWSPFTGQRKISKSTVVDFDNNVKGMSCPDNLDSVEYIFFNKRWNDFKEIIDVRDIGKFIVTESCEIQGYACYTVKNVSKQEL